MLFSAQQYDVGSWKFGKSNRNTSQFPSSNTTLTGNTITHITIAIGTDGSSHSTRNANAVTESQKGIVLNCSNSTSLISNNVDNDLSLSAVSGVNLVDCSPL